MRYLADAQSHHVHHLTPARIGGSTSLILDRSREFRMKLHLASVPLGWAWFIPAFHLPNIGDSQSRVHTLSFPKSQIDFAIGPGSAIERVLVRLEDVVDNHEAPAPLLSDREEKQAGVRDAEGEKVKEDGE
jgi:phosphatidylinositol-3,4,5-trisphosphate 3-phosphatase/dual-specificity protein phosphatase PTEN